MNNDNNELLLQPPVLIRSSNEGIFEQDFDFDEDFYWNDVEPLTFEDLLLPEPVVIEDDEEVYPPLPVLRRQNATHPDYPVAIVTDDETDETDEDDYDDLSTISDNSDFSI